MDRPITAARPKLTFWHVVFELTVGRLLKLWLLISRRWDAIKIVRLHRRLREARLGAGLSAAVIAELETEDDRLVAELYARHRAKMGACSCRGPRGAGPRGPHRMS